MVDGLMASYLFYNQGFEPEWLYTGENFGKVLTTLLAVNFATQGKNFTTYILKQMMTEASHRN